jgi:hypothetical protein
MLVRLLSTHPRLRIIAGESRFYQDVYGNRAGLGRVGSPAFRHLLEAYLEDRRGAKTEWRGIELEPWLAAYDRLGSRDPLDLYLALMQHFAESSWYAERGALGAEDYVGDKDPGALFFLDHLVRHFRGAKVLNALRDGRAVAASQTRASFGTNDVADAALHWRTYVRWSERIERQLPPNSVLRVAYEDLVTDPKSTSMQICDFLGVPYDPAMLEANVSGLSSFAGSADGAVDPTRIRRYRETLSAEELSTVERVAGHELVACGYTLETEGASHAAGAGIAVRGAALVASQRLRTLAMRLGLLRTWNRFRVSARRLLGARTA